MATSSSAKRNPTHDREPSDSLGDWDIGLPMMRPAAGLSVEVEENPLSKNNSPMPSPMDPVGNTLSVKTHYRRRSSKMGMERSRENSRGSPMRFRTGSEDPGVNIDMLATPEVGLDALRRSSDPSTNMTMDFNPRDATLPGIREHATDSLPSMTQQQQLQFLQQQQLLYQQIHHQQLQQQGLPTFLSYPLQQVSSTPLAPIMIPSWANSSVSGNAQPQYMQGQGQGQRMGAAASASSVADGDGDGDADADGESPDDTAERKQRKNVREKLRRSEMNEKFDDLFRVVTGSSKPKKADKIGILDKSAKLILALQEENRWMREVHTRIVSHLSPEALRQLGIPSNILSITPVHVPGAALDDSGPNGRTLAPSQQQQQLQQQRGYAGSAASAGSPLQSLTNQLPGLDLRGELRPAHVVAGSPPSAEKPRERSLSVLNP